MPSPEIPGDDALAARYRPRLAAEVAELRAASGAGAEARCMDCAA